MIYITGSLASNGVQAPESATTHNQVHSRQTLEIVHLPTRQLQGEHSKQRIRARLVVSRRFMALIIYRLSHSLPWPYPGLAQGRAGDGHWKCDLETILVLKLCNLASNNMAKHVTK